MMPWCDATKAMAQLTEHLLGQLSINAPQNDLGMRGDFHEYSHGYNHHNFG